MTTLYFFSPKGTGPVKDPSLYPFLHSYHWWSAKGATWAYGIVHPNDRCHVLSVVDVMTALGIYVFPSVHDTSTVPPEIVAALAAYGVTTNDNTFTCATKMAAVAGKHMRPHLY